MKSLTEPELKEFIDDLDRIAVSIGIIRQRGNMDANHPLTTADTDALLLEEIKILRASARVTAQNITFNVVCIRTQLDALKTATLSMDKTLSRIKSVQAIIDFSTLTIKIADDFVSGDAIAFSASVDKLLVTISTLNGRATTKRKA